MILEVDPHYFFYVFSLISNVNININKLKKWIIAHNDFWVTRCLGFISVSSGVV